MANCVIYADLTEPEGGITINGSLDYSIPASEMDRLVKLDFGAYDDSEALAEFNGGGKNGTNPNRIGKMFEKIPESYRIKANTKTKFAVEM